ncbi:MAG: hypothetical protein ACJ754_06930 [Pyrinomonadaceae bacterium]
MARKQTTPAKEEGPPGPERAQTASFSMLPSEIDLIQDLRRRYQRRCLTAHKDSPADVTKSEIVRAGLTTLKGMSDDDLFKAVEDLTELKEGRPPKSGADTQA